MALVPIISQTWDTTSIFNPTRMNNIEQNLAIVSKATGVEYSSGVSVKDKIDSMDSYGSFALNNSADYSSYIDTKWGAAAQKRGSFGLISLSVRFKNVSAATGSKTIFEFPSGAIIPSMTYSVNVETTNKNVFTLIISSSGVQIQNPPALSTADILACNIPYL